jgi:hypothetical protein
MFRYALRDKSKVNSHSYYTSYSLFWGVGVISIGLMMLRSGYNLDSVRLLSYFTHILQQISPNFACCRVAPYTYKGLCATIRSRTPVSFFKQNLISINPASSSIDLISDGVKLLPCIANNIQRDRIAG